MDDFTFSETLFTRKESARKTLRKISNEDVESLVQKIFSDDITHPWFSRCEEFLKTHKSEQGYAGEIEEGASFVFYPESGRGMWFREDGKHHHIGVLQPAALTALSGLVKEQKEKELD